MKEFLPVGSRYRSARLRDPEVVEMLAELPPGKAQPPELEEYDLFLHKLSNIEDRLTQVLYVSGHQDPNKAPLAMRPILPHEQKRKEKTSQVLKKLVARYQ